MHMALVLNYRKVLHPQFLRASWTNLILVIGINGAYGLLNSQIDNAGHLGGFLAGLGWGLVITVPNFPAHIHPSRLWLKKIVFATTLAAAISYAILPKTDSVPYLHFTGHQALERDDTASAIASFERLLTLQPDHVETQYNLAVIYARQGDYPAAAKHANAALQLLPDNSQIKRLNEALAPLLTEP